MKIIRFVLNVLTLISSIVCLYTLISILADIIIDNDTFLDILLYNLFACPTLSMINCLLNFNKEDKNNE